MGPESSFGKKWKTIPDIDFFNFADAKNEVHINFSNSPHPILLIYRTS